ncbi:MAG: hypothetical protein PVG53_07160 [Holophagae bacterium]|jgi:hypothetical protein
MDWIEQNLDAYRVIAEILNDLRPLVRERLESQFGREWFRDGIPEEIFDRLIRNKEQEASIDWYENRYQEVISYAVFPDLFEIINANPTLFGPMLKLAPSPSLLSTRFLELEVMRSKIGRAREVSEAEINFLTSFHLRFRRAIQELKGAPVEPVGDLSDPAGGETPAASETPIDGPSVAKEQKPSADSEPDAPSVRPASDRPARPPPRLASPASADPTPTDTATGDDADTESAHTEGAGAEDAGPGEEEPAAPAKESETTSSIVKRAMEKGEHQIVLRELYREVTSIAEVIWTTDQVPANPVWDRVSTNSWYEANFSTLGLRPLSDFFELISQVRVKLKSGSSKAEIQSFLNDSRFATVLLALRDMFQKNNI